MKIIQEALTFDDVLLVPAHSAVLPREVELKTQLTQIEQELEKKVFEEKNKDQTKIIVLEGNKAKVYDPYYYPGSSPAKYSNVTPAKSSKYTKKKTAGKKSEAYSSLKLQIKHLKKRIIKLENRVDQLEKE